MTKANDDGGYPLPENIDPPPICVQVPIPNDHYHIAAFLGAVNDLTFGKSWQRDEARTGLDAAAVWQRIFVHILAQLNMGGGICLTDIMDVRQNPTMPCILEKTIDGVNWEQFADLRLCTPILRFIPGTRRLQYSSDGVTFYEVADGPWTETYPPPAVTPPARPESDAEARRCNAAANAAAVYRETYREVAARMLEPVSTELELASSLGAAIGGLLTMLGISAASGPVSLLSMLSLIALQADFEANPLTDGDEERLKCIFYEHSTDDAGTVNFDYAAIYDAIDLDNPKQTLVRALLTVLGPDSLAMAGSVEYIADAECDECDDEWCYQFDLTADDGGFTIVPGASANAAWVSGQGWHLTGNVDEVLQIHRAFGESVYVSRVRSTWVGSGGPAVNYDGFYTWLDNGGVQVSVVGPHIDTQDSGFQDWNPELFADRVGMGGNFAVGYSSNFYITSVTLWGSGSNPFGGDNC